MLRHALASPWRHSIWPTQRRQNRFKFCSHGTVLPVEKMAVGLGASGARRPGRAPRRRSFSFSLTMGESVSRRSEDRGRPLSEVSIAFSINSDVKQKDGNRLSSTEAVRSEVAPLCQRGASASTDTKTQPLWSGSPQKHPRIGIPRQKETCCGTRQDKTPLKSSQRQQNSAEGGAATPKATGKGAS